METKVTFGPAKVWEETVNLPSYAVGRQDRHPLFLEERVYQGSSGSVYPYGVTDTLGDEKVSLSYTAVFLENDFIKLMILPQLGGRVQLAYDKVAQRHFIYHNEVIKPALVGLLGPWISGGIEFNWPQHHRPTTFMPVDYKISNRSDDAQTLWVGEIEPMRGLQIMTSFTVYSDRSLLEIGGKMFNPNPTPRSFLWWANPAVKGGNDHQSVFPPDVTAVVDHGRREISTFPIATGTYYKVDYSSGVDISQWRNIPVPTSYMVDRSDYNFFGAYDYAENGGLLHVADHHVSPGKKMWTWGNGEFGLAWEKNLTDSNGPYVELMAGVFTDNQPDFTWLDPFEEKQFRQYFMPYSHLGKVQNANTQAALKLECSNGEISWGIYAVSHLKQHRLSICFGEKSIFDQQTDMLPATVLQGKIDSLIDDNLSIVLEDSRGNLVLSYKLCKSSKNQHKIPDAAKEPQQSCDIQSVDECWSVGQHLQQYSHASRSPIDYYLRGIELEPYDYRCNLSMGQFEFDRANFQLAIDFCTKALTRATNLNKNPQCGMAHFTRGCAYEHLKQFDLAYADFYKSTWSGSAKSCGFANLARLAICKREFTDAMAFCNSGLDVNHYNYQLIALRAFLLQQQGKVDKSLNYIKKKIDKLPLHYVLYFLKYNITKFEADLQELQKVTSGRGINSLAIANCFVSIGYESFAIDSLKLLNSGETLPKYLRVSLIKPTLTNEIYLEMLADCRNSFDKNVRFPNSLEEVAMLHNLPECFFANYLLGCFYYNKKGYDKANQLWQKCAAMSPEFPDVWRCIGIYTFNKLQQKSLGIKYFQKAFELHPTEPRLLMELDQSMKLINTEPTDRLLQLEKFPNLVVQRDDLTAELISLFNLTDQVEKAAKILAERKFHQWEGGEGKIATQYLINVQLRAFVLMQNGQIEEAEILLRSALKYPDNLSEGRLILQTDNDIHYWLGICAEKLNRLDEAEKCWQLAIKCGDEKLGISQYYNDQPIDYQFYMGLALKKLNRTDRANELFTRLIQWSTDQLKKTIEADFFAVSVPNMSVFETDRIAERLEICLFAESLGHLGLGNKQFLIEFCHKCPNHDKSHLLLKLF